MQAKDRIKLVLEKIRKFFFGTKKQRPDPNPNIRHNSDSSLEDAIAMIKATEAGQQSMLTNYMMRDLNLTDDEELHLALAESEEYNNILLDKNSKLLKELISSIDNLFDNQQDVITQNVSPETIDAIANNLAIFCAKIKQKSDQHSYGSAVKQMHDGVEYVAVIDYTKVLEQLNEFNIRLQKVAANDKVDSFSILKIEAILVNLHRIIDDINSLQSALTNSMTDKSWKGR